MAWDKSLPNNQTKIRNYPSVLTANFGAVVEGGDTLQYWKANFIERNAIPSSPPATPTRIDDTMQVFSRQNDTDAETDLYILDDRATANTIQVTENGKLGGPAQSGILQDLAIGTEPFVNNQNNFVWAYGLCPAAGGAISGGQGLGTATIASSIYTVPFTTSPDYRPSSTNYHVLFNCVVNTGTQANNRVACLKLSSKTTNQFEFRVQRVDGLTVTDVPTQIWVIGGR